MTIRRYFAGSNTSQGFYSFLDNVLVGIEKKIVITGVYGDSIHRIIEGVSKYLERKGCSLELLHCAERKGKLDGLIWREGSVAILDGTYPHVVPEKKVHPTKEYNLEGIFQRSIFWGYKGIVNELLRKIQGIYKEAYEKLKYAKKIHDDLEILYIEGMDWDAVNKMTDEMITEFFNEYPDSKENGREYHRFAGAITPAGAVSYLDELLSGYKKRIIMKGRAGTGKSTLTKKIGKAAKKKGMTVEYYHCSFDPFSVDNIWIPEIKVCMIDGTPPHEKDPEPGDIVIDMFKFMDGKVYEKNQETIEKVDKLYYENFVQGMEILKDAEKYHQELDDLYDQNRTDAIEMRLKVITEEIIQSITTP